MSGILPLVRNTATALFPITRTVEFDTSVSIAINGNEQRYKRRQVLMRATLNYQHLNVTDRNNLRTFFNSQKGQFDPTWYFVLGKSAIGSVSGTTLTIPTFGPYYFAPSDVGGTAYIATAAGGGNPLIAAITAYVNSHQVTLATGGTASNQDTRWGIYFGNMTLLSDSLSMQEPGNEPLLYTMTLACRQTRQLVNVAPTALAAYPTLSTGLVAQRPYTQIERFYTMTQDQASGMRYSYEYYSSGLVGFPTGALFGWKLTYNISNADLATIESFFRGQWGRYGAFSFTDPDSGTLYSPCRFDSDILQIVHQGPNLNTVTIQIVQTNN